MILVIGLISCNKPYSKEKEVIEEVPKPTINEPVVGDEITTASGLKYEVITLGAGEKPGESDKVEVH
jgi:FKBP-type peptidyl-prolyl cis-trans isomerase